MSGRAAFTADMIPSNAVHVRIVRSPHARARILAIETAHALASPGVVAVVIGADLLSTTDPTPSRFAKDRFPGPLDMRALAVDRVIYVGEPVAALVAATPHEAALAASRVRVEYEPLVPVLHTEAAANGGEPVHESWGTNVAAKDLIQQGDVSAAFARADVVVEGELSLEGSTSAPMETRTYLAEWDQRGERLTLTGTFQMPHPSRWAVAKALRLRESQVRVVAPNVGGTFGLGHDPIIG